MEIHVSTACENCYHPLSKERSPRYVPLMHADGTRPALSVCERCFRRYDRRIPFWRRWKRPVYKGSSGFVGNVPFHAAYIDGVIYLSPSLETLPDVFILTALAHEYVHYLLNRDFGELTSLQFDLLADRSLVCLEGRSFNERLIECISGLEDGSRVILTYD